MKNPARGLPLYAQVVLGVVAGVVLGVVFGPDPYLVKILGPLPHLPRFGNKDLGELGTLVIRLLRALAVPLILFAILDAFARTRITARAGGRLVLICLVNVTVAMCIGLTLMNTIRPGERWRGHLTELKSVVGPGKLKELPKDTTLDPLRNLGEYVPEALTKPFEENNVISVVLLAILGGMALRKVKEKQRAQGETSIEAVERFVEAGYEIFIQMLEWVVRSVPLAVFAVVASVVGQHGFGIFRILGAFLAIILLGLGIHSLVYYPLVAWVVGRRSPRQYLGGGADAILTGLSINSSLATVPMTLKCLTQRIGITERSARLAACVGTNLNNDGITLYEAMAALFLAQAIGLKMALGQQVVVVLASIMAGIGVAGVPEAGLVVLPLVLGAAGLPQEVVKDAIPVILAVDWIIARARSGVNVMSDMLVAILLDATGAHDPADLSLPEEELPAIETLADLTP